MNPESKSHWLITLGLAVGLMLVGFASYMQANAIKQQGKKIDMIFSALSDSGSTTGTPSMPASSERTGAAYVMSQVGPFELMTGTFTFKIVCEGELFVPPTGGRDSDARTTCTGLNALVVVRDERPTGSEKIEEQVLARLRTTKDTDAVLRAEVIPASESASILVDFHENDPMQEGVCMGQGYNYIYDTVAPGELAPIRNYPALLSDHVWAYGVMAYIPGCGSGAGYPTGPVMLYNPGEDRQIRVTQEEAVAGSLWTSDDARGGRYPFTAGGDKLPYWSDLKWNDVELRFEINLNLIDGRIQPYFFNTKGEDVTPDFL